MARRKKNFLFGKRAFSLIIYSIPLLVLGYFAKDNLILELENQFSPKDQASVVSTSASIQVVFSPHRGATDAIIAAIREARVSILVSAYSFTSKPLAEALLDAKKRDVKVRIILDKSQMSQQYSSATFFINQNFEIRIDIKHTIYHNKVMIIDDKTVVTGSFNFTKAAETKNAENVIIIRHNPEIAKLYIENWRMHWQQALKPEEFLERK
jgi:phosphatidylserine/phosphatidylglycerophosphate/cardiolipin synthase-like enzyme